MSEKNIYLKIYYVEPGSKTKKILAEVNKKQLYNQVNNWVAIINYGDMEINKYDIIDIIPLDEGNAFDLSLIRKEFHQPSKAKATGV